MRLRVEVAATCELRARTLAPRDDARKTTLERSTHISTNPQSQNRPCYNSTRSSRSSCSASLPSNTTTSPLLE